MSGTQTDLVAPENPELLASAKHVLSVGCGKPIIYGTKGRFQLTLKCSRIRRCDDCQRLFANLDKVQLLNIIERLSSRNRLLLELIEQANQK